MGVFRLDVTSMISFGCLSSGAYISSLIGQVVLLALVVIAVMAAYIYNQNKAKNETTNGDSPEIRAHVRELFDRFDTDGEGVKLDEVTVILAEIDPAITADQAAIIFKEADLDGSGIIDYDEFFVAVHTSHSSTNGGLDLQKLVLKKQALDIRDSATGQLFLIVFLLYPSFTNKIFEGFSCRSIGEDEAFLFMDYTLDCNSGTYTVLYMVLLLLMLLWPIGVPAFLFWQMYKEESLILAGDADTLQKFVSRLQLTAPHFFTQTDAYLAQDFAIGDYKTTHYYW